MEEKYQIMAEQAGEALGLDFDTLPYTKNDLARGIEVELEHGARSAETNVTNDDITMTAKIALAHLNERADYYDGLEFVEKAPGSFWRAFNLDNIKRAIIILVIIICIMYLLRFLNSGGADNNGNTSGGASSATANTFVGNYPNYGDFHSRAKIYNF